MRPATKKTMSTTMYRSRVFMRTFPAQARRAKAARLDNNARPALPCNGQVELSRFAARKIGWLHFVLKVFLPDRSASLEGILPSV